MKNYRIVLAYSLTESDSEHEAWLIEWGLAWFGSHSIHQLDIRRFEYDGEIHIRIDINAGGEIVKWDGYFLVKEISNEVGEIDMVWCELDK